MLVGVCVVCVPQYTSYQELTCSFEHQMNGSTFLVSDCEPFRVRGFCWITLNFPLTLEVHSASELVAGLVSVLFSILPPWVSKCTH